MSELGSVAFIPETVAVALDYGYFKAQHREFPEGGYCDMGEYCTTLSLVRFTNVRFGRGGDV